VRTPGDPPRRGAASEDLAARWLEARGYRIVARNFRTRRGEIDLVAEDRGVTVFVEVRARTASSHGSAIATISPAKRRRIVSAARVYAARFGLGERPLRFDTVSLDGDGGSVVVRHDPGAFTVTDA
jgi:putative endonuclease